MTIKYEEVVPWGRNFDEYARMFDLQEHELKLKIIGCGDGPASFNSEGNKLEGSIISVDPLYKFSRDEIENRIHMTYHDVIDQTRNNQENFRWDRIKSVEELGEIRMKSMRVFLESYDMDRAHGKYIPASLPHLPFHDQEFDIALSSHFLFLYTDNLSYEFHVISIREMLRVAREVRIFPLLDMNSNRSSYIDRIIEDFRFHSIEIRMVDYEFQIGGNEVLIVRNL